MANNVQLKIKKIVTELSKNEDDNATCKLLMDLKPIVEREASDPNKNILTLIWKYKLPQTILNFLRDKSTYLKEEAMKTCYLSSVVVDCCIEYPLDATFVNEFIPQLTYTLFITINNMVHEYGKRDKKFQSNLCGNISWIVMIFGKLAEKYISTSITMMSSKHFMQLLMVEDASISLIALSFLKNLIKVNSNIFYHIAESRAHSIVEELTFKLFGSSEDSVAKVALSVLLLLLEVHPALVELFTTKKYRGFKTYVAKLHGKGFDEEIRKMLNILDVQTKRLLTTQKEGNAAIVIQSCYRGYKHRKKLKNAIVAITKFQIIYRRKRRKMCQLQSKEKLDKMKTEYIEAERRKAFVDSRIKQMAIIDSIPAKTVNKFLEENDANSARIIQSAWKGYQTRKHMITLKPEMKKIRSAILIQRAVRKWLKRCRSKVSDRLISLMPSGLDDQCRCELQQVIGNLRNRFPVECKTDDEFRGLHEQGLRKLNNHVAGLREMRRRDEHRNALMAQLTVLSEQLLYSPSLDSATESHIEQYSSYSTPVAMAARQQHNDKLNEQNMPWWKKLDQENFYENKEFARPSKSFYLNEEKQF